MYRSILFAGPGLNKAFATTISSNVFTSNLFKKLIIPLDSNWNIPSVFPVLNIFSVSLSFNAIFSILKSLLISFTFLIASLNILKFFKPKKSIFNSPICSRYSGVYPAI